MAAYLAKMVPYGVLGVCMGSGTVAMACWIKGHELEQWNKRLINEAENAARIQDELRKLHEQEKWKLQEELEEMKKNHMNYGLTVVAIGVIGAVGAVGAAAGYFMR
jgi:hypothetical protein